MLIINLEQLFSENNKTAIKNITIHNSKIAHYVNLKVIFIILLPLCVGNSYKLDFKEVKT